MICIKSWFIILSIWMAKIFEPFGHVISKPEGGSSRLGVGKISSVNYLPFFQGQLASVQSGVFFCTYWITHRWLTTESLNIWSYISPWLSCRGGALFLCVECPPVPTDTGYLCSLLTASKSSQQLINWLTSYLGLVFGCVYYLMCSKC